eukprot:scaffold4194_cov131-Isochrysis_galbana.AAC.10
MGATAKPPDLFQKLGRRGELDPDARQREGGLPRELALPYVGGVVHRDRAGGVDGQQQRVPSAHSVPGRAPLARAADDDSVVGLFDHRDVDRMTR